MAHGEYHLSKNGARQEGKKMPLKIKVALVYGFFECLLFVGFIFGWASLVYVFKQDGLFSTECDDESDQSINKTGDLDIVAENLSAVNDTNGQGQGHITRFNTCEAQDSRFSLIISITFGLFCSFVVSGWMLDRFGLRVTRLMGSVLMALTMFFWAFTTTATSWIIMAAGICVAIATTFLIVSNSSATQMAGRYSSVAAGFYNGAISSTPATTALSFKLLYDAGVPRQYSLAFLATLLLVVFIFGSFKIFPHFKATDAVVHVKNDTDAATNQDSGTILEKDMHSSGKNDSDDEQVKDITVEYKSPEKSETNDTEQSISSSLSSSLFLLQLFWHVVLVVRIQFVYNVFNSWLSRTFDGDVEKVSYYTSIFGYMQALNLPLSLVVGLITDALRNPKQVHAGMEKASAACSGLLLTTVVATTLSCMFLEPVRQAGPEKVMIVITMLLACCLQSFVFATANCFFNLAFPGSQFGRLFGLSNGMAGIFAFSMYGLIAWGNRTPGGSAWFEVDLFLMILCALTSIHPLNIWYQCYKQKKT